MLAFSGRPALAARAQQVLDRAHALATEHDRPDLVAQVRVFRGMVAICACRYPVGLAHVEAGLAQFAQLAVDATYERAVARTMAFSAHIGCGRLRDALVAGRRWVADQEVRRNRFGRAMGRLLVGFAALGLEGLDPTPLCVEIVAERQGEALRGLVLSMVLMVQASSALYFERPTDALAVVQRHWGPVVRQGGLLMQFARVFLLGLRGRCGAAAGTPAGRRIARRCARRLLRERCPQADGEAAISRALLTPAGLDPRAHWARAEAAFAAAELPLQRAAAAWAGSGGSAEIQATFQAAGVHDPAGWSAVLIGRRPSA
ncbi:MAG: hypothetical protein H6702_12085 [Myxococcales bacterium]|nr:hypothetical protein [Myxococcales bacterium]